MLRIHAAGPSCRRPGTWTARGRASRPTRCGWSAAARRCARGWRRTSWAGDGRLAGRCRSGGSKSGANGCRQEQCWTLAPAKNEPLRATSWLTTADQRTTSWAATLFADVLAWQQQQRRSMRCSAVSAPGTGSWRVLPACTSKCVLMMGPVRRSLRRSPGMLKAAAVTPAAAPSPACATVPGAAVLSRSVPGRRAAAHGGSQAILDSRAGLTSAGQLKPQSDNVDLGCNGGGVALIFRSADSGC